MSEDITEVGVIVGRFQCSFLHEGHCEIIDHVVNKHPRVFIFIGQTPLNSTFKDPLDFTTRRAMIEEKYPEIEVHRLDDVGDDRRWSEELDMQVSILAGPNQKVTLYGSRDSFLKSYMGNYPRQELEATKRVSATEIRKKIGIKSKKTKEFREGAIWVTQNQAPRVIPMVHVIPFNMETNEIGVVVNPDTQEFSVVGGIAPPTSDCYETDAIHFLDEGSGYIIGTNIEYVGSTLLDLWQYSSQVDKVKTMLYVVTKWTIRPQPYDPTVFRFVSASDIDGNLDVVYPQLKIHPKHAVFFRMFGNWLRRLEAVKKMASKANKT